MGDQLAIWDDKLEQIVMQCGFGEDGSHDLTHLRRVLKNANQIADEIGVQGGFPAEAGMSRTPAARNGRAFCAGKRLK